MIFTDFSARAPSAVFVSILILARTHLSPEGVEPCLGDDEQRKNWQHLDGLCRDGKKMGVKKGEDQETDVT